MIAMTMSRPALLVLLALGIGMAGCNWGGDEAAAAGKPAQPVAGAGSPVVLVELFTSQGCSSCPPADRLLGELPAAVDGVQVLPLAFHVDYWNDLGWRDPFSSAQWTQRQEGYAKSIAEGRIYTPQLVVQGREHVVGSKRGEVLDLIRRAAGAKQSARIKATSAPRADGIAVSVDASLGGAGRADAWVALVENSLATKVARGENQGRALVNHFVVRRLARAFQVEGGAARAGQVTLALDPSWRRDHLSVTVFLQDPDSRAVLAAASAGSAAAARR
jgi:hypothetical protein